MAPELDALIERFRAAQDQAVRVLTHDLGIPRPASNRAWVADCDRSGVHAVRERDGVGLYAHGYGIEVTFRGTVVDFDWGDHGEADGFDAWRLWRFRKDNDPGIECTQERLREWLAEAHARGELTQDRALFYDPRRRAPA